MSNLTKYFNHFNFQNLVDDPNVHTKTYEGLSLAKYNVNVKPAECSIEEYYKHFCRGIIVKEGSNEIVCLPTPKRTEGNPYLTDTESESEPIIQQQIDGTMVNMFYNTLTSEWCISTRTVINANCRWKSPKTFSEMFYEIVEDECNKATGVSNSHDVFFDQFSKDTSYSFVIQHKENRIVSHITDNSLWLVDAYKLDWNCEDNTNIVEQVDLDNYYKTIKESRVDKQVVGFTIPYKQKIKSNVSKSDLWKGDVKDSLNEKLHWSNRFVVKYCGHRVNIENTQYDEVKKLKGNSNNKLFTYIDQRYKGIIKDYLKYFPEDGIDYNHYREKIHILTQELYNFYNSTFKQKTTSLKNDVPYQLKPLCYELHGLYLSTKKAIHFKTCQDFINKMVPQRMYFVLKFYFTNIQHPSQVNTHHHFKQHHTEHISPMEGVTTTDSDGAEIYEEP